MTMRWRPLTMPRAVEFDESTGSYQSQVSMVVRDPATGKMIGAITFGINVQSLL